jgi:hypothetical protein
MAEKSKKMLIENGVTTTVRIEERSVEVSVSE